MNKIQIKQPAATAESIKNFQQKRLQEMRQKLNAVLTANNVMPANEMQKACASLDNLNLEERKATILKLWGPLYLNRALPILNQLEALEKPN